jgi:hypothetical protein
VLRFGLASVFGISLVATCTGDANKVEQAACRPASPCPAGWFSYDDTACSPPYLGSGAGCNHVGDGLCYQPCQTDTDCGDPRFPNCDGMEWFGGDDTREIRSVCKGDGVTPACPASVDAATGAADECSAFLPLECGDRLNHSTLVEGRANAWQGYAQTARLESGRETIYLAEVASACEVTVRLTNLTTDLDLLLLTDCDPMANGKASSIPLGPQTEETVTWTTEVGSRYYVVVDGYAGAAGSYTLEVDCTCR